MTKYAGIIKAMRGCLSHLENHVYICHAIDSWAKSNVVFDKFAEKNAIHAKALIHRMIGADNVSLYGWIESSQGISPSPKQMKAIRVRWVRRIISDLERMK